MSLGKQHIDLVAGKFILVHRTYHLADGIKTAVAFVSEHGKGQIKLFDKFSVKLIRHF